jgi:O-antigen ligase
MTAQLPLPEPGTGPQTAAGQKSNSGLLYGVTAVLMFSPLAFGAVEAWSIFVVEGSAGALFLLWMRTQLGSPQLNIRWNPVFAPMLAFAGLFAIQLMPGRSAYWHATGSQALLFAACGMICFLIGQTFTQHRQVRKIASALTIYGSAVALIAVLQNLTSPNRLYWLRTPRFGGWIFGPYVNHNHYAGLMEMLVPVPLVFAFSRFGRTHQRRAAVVAAVFMSLTIFLSGSRGGMLAFLVEIAVFAAFVYRGQQKQQRIMLAAFGIILAGIVVWTGGHALKERVSTLAVDAHSDLPSDIRLQIDRDTLRIFRQRPLLGWGQGTFTEVYPQFRTFYTDAFVNAAHNDFLQRLAETGIAGFSIMIWFLVRALRPALRKSIDWHSDVNGTVALAATLGITGILVHSLVDFNMQVPANAALFYALCTVAAVEHPFTMRARKRNRTEQSAAWHSPEFVNS